MIYDKIKGNGHTVSNKPVCKTCTGEIGLDIPTSFEEIKTWWNNLPQMQKYLIIGGAGVITLLMLIPSGNSSFEEKMEQWMEIQMAKEMGE